METFDSAIFLGMLEQARNVNSFTVLNGSSYVAYCNNLPALFTDKLSSPGTNIAKSLT